MIRNKGVRIRKNPAMDRKKDAILRVCGGFRDWFYEGRIWKVCIGANEDRLIHFRQNWENNRIQFE